MKNGKPQPYALVRVTHESGYGHMNLRFYDLFPEIYDRPEFVITSQCTGGENGKLYAWKHGIVQTHDPLGVDALRAGATLMLRIHRGMAKLSAEGLYPKTFAEYVVAIARFARVRNIHYVEAVNGGFSGETQNLPVLDCFREPDPAIEKLKEMSDAVCRR